MRLGVGWTVLLLSLAGAASAGMEVRVQSDPAADLGRFRTYAWAAGTKAEAAETDARIVAALERELAARGLARADGEADLKVAYHASATEELEPEQVVRGYGSGHFSGAGWYRKPEKRYRKGTLVLDLVDARSGQLVWHGTVSDVIAAVPEKNGKKIDQAAHKLLSRYPKRKV